MWKGWYEQSPSWVCHDRVSSVHVLAFSSSPPVISNFQLKLSPHPQCLWQHYRNEWYRRLIRSNRPLYRACPKHTKLLVSKAIVQAVEEQGGRFLERSRRTGMWYIVPYKRAVDKTSQGLRERDKDDDLAPVVTQLRHHYNHPQAAKLANLI